MSRALHENAMWILLLLLMAQPGAVAGCSENDLSQWLYLCAMDLQREKLAAAARRPRPADPWAQWREQEILLEIDEHLPSRLAARCAPLRPAGACPASQAVTLLQRCVADAQALAGKQRQDIALHFEHDGGLSTAAVGRFVHRQCQIVKIGVTFRHIKDAEGRARELPSDLIESVHAYIGLANAD